jgi:hypothetical protein
LQSFAILAVDHIAELDEQLSSTLRCYIDDMDFAPISEALALASV